jgi:hypothetical protein
MMPERKNILLERVEELLEVERRFNTIFGAHPVPTWIKFLTKDDRLVMGMVNASYTLATGISVTAYLGKPDNAVWVAGEPEEFNVNDRAVIRTGMPQRTAEKAVNPRTKKVQIWVGWKWPYIYHGRVIGVVGCAEGFNEDFWRDHGEAVLTALGEIK